VVMTVLAAHGPVPAGSRRHDPAVATAVSR
jgi:hypothetical protein